MDLITEIKGLNGIEFSLGDKVKMVGIENLQKMKQSLEDYLNYVEHWQYYIDLYKDYDIEKYLENLYIDGEEDEYSVGNVFHQYIDGDVTEYLKEHLDYFDELSIDDARDYTYICIKSKDTARKFLSWTYETLIKPKLDTFK